jgi:crotonobetainyl-CoA:carnitine CoA-transferase CaiB-like acyl-CoA transferase
MPPPLNGLKVVDLTRVLAGPYCTMLLADMGAEVIKIEAPGDGDETRAWPPFVGEWSAFFLAINRGKRAVALDLKASDDAGVFRRLLAQADVLVENVRPGSLDRLGFGIDAVREINPRLIHCSISGYGHTGPLRTLGGYDPIMQAESGFMDVNGLPDGPPVRTGVAMTDYIAALYALSGILLALRDRDRTGLGQHVDIALFDAIFSTLARPVVHYESTGEPALRAGNDHPAIAPYEALNTRDGLIMIAAGNQRLWRQLCAAIDRPALADDERFATNQERVAHRPELKRALEDAFEAFSLDALIDRLQAAGVPCGRVRTVPDAMRDPQVAAREMLLPLEVPGLGILRTVGNPIKLSASPATPGRRPPAHGEHTDEVLRELGCPRPTRG